MKENINALFRVGFIGIGLSTYWDQFAGLKPRLETYMEHVANRLGKYKAEVINAGLVDTPEKAFETGDMFRSKNVELIFLYATTYALSSTVLPIVRKARVPVIVLNLAPGAAIDYASFNQLPDRTRMTGEWLAYCGACPVPEIISVLKRLDLPVFQVTGMLQEDPEAWREIGEWMEAAHVRYVMEHNRLGLMGNYYGGMLDIYSNLTLHCIKLGGHIEIIEVDELSAIRASVTDSDMDEKIKTFFDLFDMQPDCDVNEIRRAAKTAVALDQLVYRHRLGSMAYYYKGTGNADNLDTMSSVILGNSLLTAAGIPVAGEYEVKNVQAMKIMQAFGAGGSFTEYYAMDFKDDVVLMGHDGPCHPAIAAGKTRVKPLTVYHGKVGNGLSVEMSVTHGPVTLLSVVETNDGKLMFLVAEAESVAGPILQIGNTNSRYRFSVGARRFVEAWNARGPAHHCAVGKGHLSSSIIKLGLLLGIDVVKIC